MADFNEYKGVWVFCEQRQGALMSTDFELVSEARKLADELGCEVTGLLLGDNVEGIAKELGGYGADKVMVCDSPLLKDYTTDASVSYTHLDLICKSAYGRFDKNGLRKVTHTQFRRLFT